MSKLFVMPKAFDTSLNCVTLKHPKDWSECMFYYHPNQSAIHELSIQKNHFHSWFVNDSLLKDGNIYMITPIDPLFLLIPFVYKITDKFQNLFDILIENNVAKSHIEFLQSLFSPNILKCISDVKSFEDEIFIKFNKANTIKWLSLKFENIKNSLANNGIGKNLYGFQVSDFVSGDAKLSEDEYKVLAFEIISDYICQELGHALRDKLGIPDKSALFASISDSAKVGHKRKMESDHTTFMEDIDHMNSRASKEPNKKPKLSRTQLALSKVDKSGMKSISSYFQKKK